MPIKETISADLEIPGLEDAARRVDQFYTKVSQSFQKIDNLVKNSPIAKDFARNLAEVEKRAGQVQRQFQQLVNIPSRGNTLDGLSASALKLSRETALVRQRLDDIRKVNIAGKSESFLKILAEDAQTAELQLARLERRAEILRSRRATPGAAIG